MLVERKALIKNSKNEFPVIKDYRAIGIPSFWNGGLTHV
jgi:hypothetical protein